MQDSSATVSGDNRWQTVVACSLAPSLKFSAHCSPRQVGWLLFFLLDAVHHFWYNSWLLVPCFVTGATLNTLHLTGRFVAASKMHSAARSSWLLVPCFITGAQGAPSKVLISAGCSATLCCALRSS